ncbi:MAG: hypothetical protein R3E90_00640 [Marinicella sp.]
MKYLILIGMFFLSMSCDAQLIFKNGFENTGTVSGMMNGLASGSIELQLSTSLGIETIEVNENGAFVFGQEIVSGASYAVTVSAQPSGQFCSVNNGEGHMLIGGVDDVHVNCGVSNNWDEMNWDEGVWQ